MNYQQIQDKLIQNILYGCTDDVATTRGVKTSPAVAIIQPDTSRGDSNTQYMSDNNIGQLKRPPEQLIKEREDEQLRLAIELSMQEDYKDSDMIAEPKNVSSASKNGGDNSNTAFAFLPPESGAKSQVDIKTGSKSNTKNDIFRFGPARRNNSSTDGIVGDVGKLSVAVTQPEHTGTDTGTDTVMTQNTTSSYNTNKELANIRRKEKDAKRKKKKRRDPA